jgi:hypothetical protein
MGVLYIPAVIADCTPLTTVAQKGRKQKISATFLLSKLLITSLIERETKCYRATGYLCERHIYPFWRKKAIFNVCEFYL